MFHFLATQQIRRLRNRVRNNAAARRKKTNSDESEECRHERWKWLLESTSAESNTESDLEGGMSDNGIENTVWGRVMSSPKGLFLALLAFRMLNALVIRTSYVPDEYWQSLEVAHNMAYGYGYLTWEWKHALRGYTYPGIYAAIFKMLEMLHLDYRILLIRVPPMLNGVLAACCDYYLYKLSERLSGYKVAQWTLLCQVSGWFTFYCGTRSLTNSAETALTTVAFYYYPWTVKSKFPMWKFLSIAALAVIVRPTAAIIWLPLCICQLYLYRHNLLKVLKSYIIVGCVALVSSVLIDRLFYGRWVFVQYNFLHFNVLHNIGSFYGSHPWHWYFSQGLPIVLGPHFIPLCAAVKKIREPLLLPVMLFTLFVYSLLPHKEFRFIFPIVPIAMHFCGNYLHHLHQKSVRQYMRDTRKKTDERQPPVNHRSEAHYWLLLIIIISIPMALYSCLLHQRGTVDVMKFLSDSGHENNNISALFLMPCHSTPYYSYVHQNISMRFLTCEPNLNKRINYTDEADLFYSKPVKWLKYAFPKGRGIPTHIVIFDELESKIKKFFEKYQYRNCANIFHTHLPDGRVSGRILIKCLNRKPNVNIRVY